MGILTLRAWNRSSLSLKLEAGDSLLQAKMHCESSMNVVTARVKGAVF